MIKCAGKDCKILLLGGTGFVGSVITPYISDFSEVFIPYRGERPLGGSNIQFIKCDSNKFWSSLIDSTKNIKFDFILNLIRTDFDKAFFMELIDFIKKQKIKNNKCKVLHFSSIAEYRKIKKGYSWSKVNERNILCSKNICDAILTLPIVRENPKIRSDLAPLMPKILGCKKLLNNMMISSISPEFLCMSVRTLLQDLMPYDNKNRDYTAISDIESFGDFLGVNPDAYSEYNTNDLRQEIVGRLDISNHLKEKILGYLDIADIDDEQSRSRYNHHLTFGNQKSFFDCHGTPVIYQDVVWVQESNYVKLFPKAKLST